MFALASTSRTQTKPVRLPSLPLELPLNERVIRNMTLEQRSTLSKECQALLDNISARHFALVYIDRYGKIHREVSPSIIHHRDSILSQHVTREFLKAVANSTELSLRRPLLENTSTQPFTNLQVSYAYDTSFSEDLPIGEHIVPMTSGCHESSTLWPSGRVPSTAMLKNESLDRKRLYLQKPCFEPQEASLHIKDTCLLRRYYEKVFRNLQQTNCRVLAKVYVKLVEPQKQVKYPYNGRKAVAGVTQQLSPEETKPPWWPVEVRHREPDHLLTAERIQLLLHIFCDLGHSHGITSQRLKNADQSVRSRIIPVERLELLDELYRVRGEEEKFWGGFLENDAAILISRINLPTADEITSKHGRPKGRVSLKSKKDSALYKSSFRQCGAQSAPKCPQNYYAEYTTGQGSMVKPLTTPAMPFTPPEKENQSNKETCFNRTLKSNGEEMQLLWDQPFFAPGASGNTLCGTTNTGEHQIAPR